MYPNGQLMFNLIKDWQERVAKYELDAIEIGSPLFTTKQMNKFQHNADRFMKDIIL
jgi:hypothetical protein